MAHDQHLADKNTCHRQQYPSPDTSFVDNATSAPPSPPPSTSSSSASPRRPAASTAALPPSVVAAFQCIRDSYEGRYTGPSWIKFPNVSTDDLDALLSAADSIGAYKQRYDYDPSKRLLILRMPEGRPHLFTKNGLAGSIWKCLTERMNSAIQQLQEVKEPEWESRTQALRNIKSSIIKLVEARTNLPRGEQKSPDVAFFYKSHVCPPLVVEVGHSQKGAELTMLARKYIGKTDGDIGTVITVNIAYNTPDQRAGERRRQRLQQQGEEPKHGRGPTTRSRSRQRQRDTETAAPDQTDPFEFAASVSLFRLGERVVHSQPFREIHGDQVDGNLELNMADFVPLDAETAIPRSALEEIKFAVPFSDLYDALTWGEEQQMLEEQTPPPQTIPRTGRKRVHFESDWDLPEAMLTQLDADEGADGHGDLTSRNTRSLKKRRTGSDKRSPSSRSGSSPSSRLDKRGSGNGDPATMPYRRRSSSRLKGDSSAGSTDL